MDRTLYRARMAVSREQLDALMDALTEMEPCPTSWEDMETGEAWVEIYEADRASLVERARQMADLAGEVDGRIHAADITILADSDWTEEWKKFFHTTRVSPRIVIHPSWEAFDPAVGDIVVDIDPGMSFGTGLHPTTRACLNFLDQLASELVTVATFRVVDLGCGSGILAIAATKLGFASVTALDNDPLAVRISHENMALNGVNLDTIVCAVGDVLQGTLPEGEIVVANILAPVLIEAAPRIARAVAPRVASVLVLSGILDQQFPEVSEAYRQEGFDLGDSILDGEWRTGLFRRRNYA